MLAESNFVTPASSRQEETVTSMKREIRFLPIFLFCFLAAPLLAQTQVQIGGGTCTSSSLNGIYSFTLTGRQVTASGSFSAAFQSNGTASFDGQSKVTVTLTANTNQANGIPLSLAGTYSLSANCSGTVNITTGDTVNMSLTTYNQGRAFLVTGSDATYLFNGGGNLQPATCANTLTGVYTVNGNGYLLSGTSVLSVGDGTGLLQFDAQGNVTINFSASIQGTPATSTAATGTYSLSSTCLGSATLTDTAGHTYTLTFSITAPNNADFNALFARSQKFIFSGSAHAVYGQPSARVVRKTASKGAQA